MGEPSKKQKMSTALLCNYDDYSYIQFEKLRTQDTYVDKTLFIKAFFEAKCNFILVTAPRRFGKSSNINMLKQFLLGRRDLFVDTEILKEESFFDEHCQHHPVISVDFGIVNGKTYDDILMSIREVISEAFKEHKFLYENNGNICVWKSDLLKMSDLEAYTFEKYVKSEKCKRLTYDEVVSGLMFLSEVLHKHYAQKVFILIDEYDAPILHTITKDNLSEDDANETYTLLQDLMSRTIKFNKHAERALLAACVQLAGALSGDSHTVIEKFPFLKTGRFEKFFGFTTEEVDKLLDMPKFSFLKKQREKVNEWYKGYDMPSGDQKIYSGWSLLHVLEDSIKVPIPEPLFRSHWVDTGILKNIVTIFANLLIRPVIEQLIEGQQVTIETKQLTVDHVMQLKEMVKQPLDGLTSDVKDLFLQYLADSGYLCSSFCKQESETDRRYELKVPNKEIRSYLIECCYNAAFFEKQYNLTNEHIEKFLQVLDGMLKSSNDSLFQKFANAVANLFYASAKLPQNEDELHCIFFTLIYNRKKYDVSSELHVKKQTKLKGRPKRLDILVILGKSAILFDLKYHQPCDKQREQLCEDVTRKGLAQIFDKKYYNIFKEEHIDVSRKIYACVCLHESRKVSVCYTENNTGVEGCKFVVNKVKK